MIEIETDGIDRLIKGLFGDLSELIQRLTKTKEFNNFMMEAIEGLSSKGDICYSTILSEDKYPVHKNKGVVPHSVSYN